MSPLTFIKQLLTSWICALLALGQVFAITAAADTPSSTSFVTVVVNGRTLTGPQTQGQERDGRYFVPVKAVADALGDVAAVDANDRTIKLNRQTGVAAVYDTVAGHVLENGAVVLTTSQTSDVVFSPNLADVQLPIELAAALFGAAIRYDAQQKALLVVRGPVSNVGQVSQTTKRSRAELYFAEYEYGLGRYAASPTQNLTLRSTGRLADSQFTFSSISSSRKVAGFTPRNISFALSRPNGQKYVAGDIGPGTAMPLMNSNVRGGLVEMPVSSFRVTAFGGKTGSGDTQFLMPDRPNRGAFHRDTFVYGGFLSTGPKHMFSGGKDDLSVGAMSFSGTRRTGQMISASGIHADQHLRLQADLAFGSFRGNTVEGRHVDGTATALDAAATYQPVDNLSIQGRFTRIGRKFLTAQQGLHQPVDSKAFGITWGTAKWLTSSLSASTTSRPGDLGRHESYATAAFAISPRAGLPRINISHTESSSRLYRNGSFTLVNATTDLSRLRLYLNASRMRTTGAAKLNLQLGAQYAINDRNSLEVNQIVGTGRARNGSVDWRTAGLFDGRLSFTAGGGYASMRNSLKPFGRLTASMRLPHDTSVQLNYMQGVTGPVLLVQVRGALFRRRDAGSYANAGSELTRLGQVTGRVYKDVDGDGRFDPMIDKPQGGVKVRVDGNRLVETDLNGSFTFEALTLGQHKVYLDLTSVRADLTLLDGDGRDLGLLAGGRASMDFRLVQTGRISGRVWFDKNGNGKLDEDEQPLPDVRVVTASGRDTMTDENGCFTLADLAPGEHVLLLDGKTLPEKTVTGAKPITIHVFPGRETPNVMLWSIPLPPEVKRFGTQ